MARLQEFDSDQVLRTAMELFWRDGYKTTTMRDIVRATGVAESSLYNAFGGKRGLFEASLDRYRSAVRQWRRRMEDFDSPGEGLRWYVNAVVKALSRQTDCRGCLVTNTTIELAPHDARIQRELRAGYAELEEAFGRVIAGAQAAGEIPSRLPPRTLARFLIQSLEGLRVLAKSNPGAEMLREIGETTLTLLFNTGAENHQAPEADKPAVAAGTRPSATTSRQRQPTSNRKKPRRGQPAKRRAR